LQAGLIRTVGIPNDRFAEDGLRIIRAIRFAIKLDFDIESKTFEAIQYNVELLNNISKERIQKELIAILRCENLNRLELLQTSKILSVIIPELDNCFSCEQNNPHHIFNVGKHILEATKKCNHDWDIKLAVLLHDIGKPLTKTTTNLVDHFIHHASFSSMLATDFLKKFKFNNNLINEITILINLHNIELSSSLKSTSRLVNKVGSISRTLNLLKVKEADALAQNLLLSSSKLELIEINRCNISKIVSDNSCFSLSSLAVNGRDIINTISCKPGKHIGIILNHLMQKVLDEEIPNDKDSLIKEILIFDRKVEKT